MVTYKILLDTRRAKSDNTYSVIIRITASRKVSTINTGVFIHNHLWNEDQSNVNTRHPNANLLNKKITEVYLKVQKIVLDLEGEEDFSFDALRERLNNSYRPTIINKSLLFKDYADQLIADLWVMNKAGNAIVYQTSTNRLMGYVKNPKLKFTEVNYTLLEGFKRELIKDGVKPNSISNYFRTLRAIYNKAIKAKLVDRSHYPFLDVVIKTEKTAKRAIPTPNIVKLLTTATKLKYSAKRSKDYATLCFALRGISFTDLAYLKHENIKNGVVTYRRRKTNQELNIKLLPLAIELISKYNHIGSKYLLPVLPNNIVENGKDAKRTIGQWIKTTNKWLNLIAAEHNLNVDVTTYVIRHTWATTAKRLGYSNELIAESMGHEYGNKITNIYLDNFEQSVIDEVNEKVVSLLSL
jgi:integrase/recombinase XerD